MVYKFFIEDFKQVIETSTQKLITLCQDGSANIYEYKDFNFTTLELPSDATTYYNFFIQTDFILAIIDNNFY